LTLLGPEWFKFYPVKYKWEVRNPKNQVLASRCRLCGHTVTYSDSLEKKG
jgi:formylmethanofuran dehydrogenase subunit E